MVDHLASNPPYYDALVHSNCFIHSWLEFKKSLGSLYGS